MSFTAVASFEAAHPAERLYLSCMWCWEFRKLNLDVCIASFVFIHSECNSNPFYKLRFKKCKESDHWSICVCVCVYWVCSLLIKPNFNELSLCITFISTFTQSIHTVFSSNSMKTIMWWSDWRGTQCLFVCRVRLFVYVFLSACVDVLQLIARVLECLFALPLSLEGTQRCLHN